MSGCGGTSVVQRSGRGGADPRQRSGRAPDTGSSRRLGDAGRAALHAQSLLDTVGVGLALEPGRVDGEFEDGRYRWSLEVSPWTEGAAPPPRPGAARLLELALTVQWGDGGPRERLQLRSLRLVQGGDAMVMP